MKKRIILNTLLTLLLCLVLAGCGESPAKVEVQWFAPTAYLSYDKYVWNEKTDGSYYATATIDGKPAEVVSVVIENNDTGSFTKMEEPSECDLEFDDSSYTVYLWVRLGDNQKTDLDHISAEPAAAEITIEKPVVCFEWHYDLSEKTSPIMTISVDSPDLEEGWTPVEQKGATRVELHSKLYGNDVNVKTIYQYCQKTLPESNGSWQLMTEDETFERGYIYQLCYTIDPKLLKEIPRDEAYLEMDCTGGTWGYTGGYSDGLFWIVQTYYNLTIDPVSYDLSVAADTPKIGMTAEEASARINLVNAPAGVSETVSWMVHDDGTPWREMEEGELFLNDPAIDREYMATIDLLVPNDYDTALSYVTVQAPGAREIGAPMLNCYNQRKHILVDVFYSASGLTVDPNSVDLVVDMGNTYLGDSVQAAEDNIKVTAFGQPVKVTYIDPFIEDIYGRVWDLAPAWRDTFKAEIDGAINVRYYIFRMYLEESEVTAFDNIEAVYAFGNGASGKLTSVSRGDPNSEHPGTVVTVYLDTNLMREEYTYQGSVDLNLNVETPYFGESVGQWIHSYFNYAYTSTRMYTFGEEMDVTVSAVTGTGSETLGEDYILKHDADIFIYVMHIELHESGLQPGTTVCINMKNKDRVSSLQCMPVQENGDIVVNVTYALSKLNEGRLEYNAYRVPTGSTVAAVKANLPAYATYYIPGEAPVSLEVTDVRFRKDFTHKPMAIPESDGMGDEEHFLTDGDYCMEVTLLMTQEQLDGLNGRNVSSIFTQFEIGPVMSFDGNDINEVHLFLYFTPVDMGTCEHSFTYDYVDGKAPTCAQEGEYRITCSLCGYSYTAVAPATDHDMKLTDRKDADCTHDGRWVYTCRNCGKTYTEIISAPGHTIQWTHDDNYHWLACSDCGYVPADCEKGYHRPAGDGVEVQLNGHGYYEYKCRICQYYYYELIVN